MNCPVCGSKVNYEPDEELCWQCAYCDWTSNDGFFFEDEIEEQANDEGDD